MVGLGLEAVELRAGMKAAGGVHLRGRLKLVGQHYDGPRQVRLGLDLEGGAVAVKVGRHVAQACPKRRRTGRGR